MYLVLCLLYNLFCYLCVFWLYVYLCLLGFVLFVLCFCIVSFILGPCDRASWHVTVHRDMWPCIVTCDRASWHVTVHRDKYLYNKTNQMHQFPKLYTSMKLYMFRAVPLSIIRSLFNVRHIPVPSVHWKKIPDVGQRNRPKHVQFHAGVNLGNWCIWLVLFERNGFRLCIFIPICFVCTGVRTTATEWQLNCS